MVYLIIRDYSKLKYEIKELFYFSLNINNFPAEIGTNSIIKIKPEYYKNKERKSIDTTFKSKEMILKKVDDNASPIFNDFLSKIIYENQNYKNNESNKRIPIETRGIYEDKIHSKKFPIKMDLTEFELNECSYRKALLYDKRTFWQYFFSLLKLEHLLFFSIIPSKDYNSKVIKICIFLFTFALFFAENALFLNEDAIHNIYENQGTLDIIYQIPQIIYSNIISFVIDKIIRFFSLSQVDVINENNIRKREKKNKRSKKFFRILFIKYIMFFIFSFVLLFFFWLYISCFCFVYRNTQMYLIKDTLFSFGFSLASPLIIYLISGALRIYSLRDKRKKRNLIYILSKFILF